MLKSLFYPDAIAVFGDSAAVGAPAYRLVHNLAASGFRGAVFPIVPGGGEIAGLPSFGTLREAGAGVQLALVCSGRDTIRHHVDAALEAGARAIVVLSEDLTGPAGARMTAELVEACRQRGARLLGPGSYGVQNTAHAMNASLFAQMPPRGAVAVLSESRSLCSGILDLAAARGLGLSLVASIGEKADLDECDLLSLFAEDDGTHIVAGYLESIVSGDQFIKVAESVTSAKPVVLLKAGTTPAGERAMRRHIGAARAADLAYAAAFKRSGVVRAENFDELFDFAKMLSASVLPRGNRLALLGNTSGAEVMASDTASACDLDLVELSDGTVALVSAALGTGGAPTNPLDLGREVTPSTVEAVLRILEQADEIDAVVLVVAPLFPDLLEELAKAAVRAHGARKPLAAVFLGGASTGQARSALRDAGIPEYPSPGRAVRAVGTLSEYASWRRRPPRMVTRFPVNRRRVERVINRHARTDRFFIDEIDSKEILRAYDFAIPVGQLADTAKEAIEIADRIGFPVALKIHSPDIERRSTYGGVRLNLATPEEVQDAFDLTVLRIKDRFPTARLEGVYIEKMCPRGRDVVLGMERDPHFGPMLMFGLGGIFVEVMEDVACHLAPITAEEARQMLRATRSYGILTGSGGEGLDLDAIATGLQRVSQLVTDFPQIAELEINPLVVGKQSAAPVVVGARMTLRRSPEER
jgi:acetate---CoA ligase (ADP-forming)